jgi:hypothetical protein
MFLFALTLILTGCAPAMTTPGLIITQTPRPTISAPVVSTSTATPTFDLLATGGGEWEGYRNHTPEPTCPSQTPFNLTDIPTEWLFTPTPDLNLITITIEIAGDHSQEEITRILFAKWLDHFLSESISPEWRLVEYAIDQVTIPSPLIEQCTRKLGGLFSAQVIVTVKTFLPSINKCGARSQWFIVSPGLVSESETGRTMDFKALIKKSGDLYTMELKISYLLCN